MSALGDLRRLLPISAFRRLLGLRLLSQTCDGVVAVALASYLFFSPERQTTPGDIAAVTAAVLLPFTLAGPFTGVVLDRWSRRDVLVGATLARALTALALAGLLAVDAADPALYVVVVVGFGINRFVLAGLSAALPHAVGAGPLLAANALVPTTGTIAYVTGIGLGGLAQAGGGDPGAVLVAVAGWVAAAYLGLGFSRAGLGPERGAAVQPAPNARLALTGLRAAARHLASRPEAIRAIGVVAASRLSATLTLAAAVLLHRSTYAPVDDPGAGLLGLSVPALAAGAGLVLAALVTPPVVERWSSLAAVTAGLLTAALTQAFFAATLAEEALAAAAFALSLGAQMVKICADTRVMRVVDDSYRGRVFVLYDMAFNAAVVAATCLGALLLPPSGRSAGVMAAVAVALAATAGLNARTRRPLAGR